MKLANHSCAILIFFYVLCAFTTCYAKEINFNVCRLVSDKQLAAIYPKQLFPINQKQGCQWSDKPGGTPYFQIGVIESQKNLREYFLSEMPSGYQLKKIRGLGDRGLMTVSEGRLNVIAVREGDWVLFSTVDLLYIKHRGQKQEHLWDIYRNILKRLP